MPTLEEFFAGQIESRTLFEAVLQAIQAVGPADMQISKSQIAFRRTKAFAWVWMPEKYLRRKAAPLVLTLAFHQRDSSNRWKEIVEPRPGRFTHHLEVHSVDDIDEEVRAWIREAWNIAGS